jgi:hypothetical protein
VADAYSLVPAGPQSTIQAPPTEYEQNRVINALRLFGQLQVWKNPFSNQCEEVAQLIMPEWRNTFYVGSWNFPGSKKTERQIDSNGMRCNAKHAAICDSLVTPAAMTYEEVVTNNHELNKLRVVQEHCEAVTRILFEERYQPTAGFQGQMHQNYMFLGGFGTMAMFIEALDGRAMGQPNLRGLRYRSCPMGEVFFIQNHQGIDCGFMRYFRLTAYQAWQRWPDTFPDALVPALNSGSQTQFEFLHWCELATSYPDHDPERLDYRGMPWRSTWISMTGRRILQEGGYWSYPLPSGRYTQVAGEAYGRGWAMMTLPTLKTLNAAKSDNITLGHRSAAPVYLSKDDGVASNFSWQPNAINPGGINEDGRPLMQMLPVGNFQVSKEFMQGEVDILDDMSLVALFKLLLEAPQLTATQVIEMVNEKGILLAPTVGRQSQEFVGPMTSRELDLLERMGKLPRKPAVMKEAGARYALVHTSPIAKQMRAQYAAGAMRTVEMGLNIAQATNDPSALDFMSVPRTMKGVADIQSFPIDWQATPQEMAQKAQMRAKANQMEAQIKAAPGQAAMLNAKSKAMTAQAEAAKSSGAMPQGGQVPPPGIGQPIPSYGAQPGAGP